MASPVSAARLPDQVRGEWPEEEITFGSGHRDRRATRTVPLDAALAAHLAWARRMLRGFVTARLRASTSGEQKLRTKMRRLWI
jgi:hypothetical protein